jgi:hypothetical protein
VWWRAVARILGCWACHPASAADMRFNISSLHDSNTGG